MNLKKIGLIILFIAVTVGVGYLLYRFFFAPAPTAVVTPPATTTPITGGLQPGGVRPPGGGVTLPPTPTGLPAAALVANGGLTQTTSVAGASVMSPMMTSAGDLNYYNGADGKFYRRQADGTLTAMSDKSFPAAKQIEWSPQADKAVIEFPDDSKIVYDFKAQKQVTLPSHWQDFSFSGDGQSIAAESIGLEPENRWLINVAADGSNAQLVEPLGDNADNVIVSYSPDGSVLGFSKSNDPVGFDARDELLIGKDGQNNKALRVDGFGFVPEWSPDGGHLLYSAAGQNDSYQPTLWFTDAKGDAVGANRQDLGIHTWADKCTFAGSSTVYCAVPDSLPEGAGLERSVADGIPDSIVKIDLVSGTTSTVGRPANDTTISRIVVAPDGGSLFFTDASSGSLQEMRLK